jgi:hypothetical protein
MTARLRGIQILGCLSLIAGYGLALVLIRGMFIGITRGFGAASSQVPWIALGYLLFFALAFYLLELGRRALSSARGCPRTEMRFGWGRIFLGMIFLYSSAVEHFHLLPPGPFKRFEPSNQTQDAGMNATAVVMVFGYVLLIVWGMWSGLRRRPTSPTT